MSTHVIFINIEGNIPPYETDSHKVVYVVDVGGEPALVLLFREHLHHFIFHCVQVGHSEFFNRHGGDLGIGLHIQLGLDGSEFGISLYTQLGINGLFD